MINQTKDKIIEEFFKFLTKKGVSATTQKNYKSDLKHFFAWFKGEITTLGVFADTLTEAVPFLNQDSFPKYKTYLVQFGIPPKTVNRRLSTIRQFSKFLLKSSLISFDAAINTQNINTKPARKNNKPHEVLLSNFKNYLQAQKVSSNTIKNYLSDINQFFDWIEKGQGL